MLYTQNTTVAIMQKWTPCVTIFERRYIHCITFTELCPALCDPMDYSPPGSSVHGIFQARIQEWVAIPFSRRSSRPRDWTQVSCIVGRFFTIEATREAHSLFQLRVSCDHFYSSLFCKIMASFSWSAFIILKYIVLKYK